MPDILINPEDRNMVEKIKTLCSEMISIDYWHIANCSRAATIERDGKWYCKIHDPEYIKTKKIMKQDKDKANSCERCGRLFRERWYQYCPLCGTKRNKKGRNGD